MSSVRVLGWWCHLLWVDNIAKWFELPCAFAIARCAKFCRGYLEIVSILRKSILPSAVQPSPHLSWKSRPHSWKLERKLVTEQWRGFLVVKKLISHCQKPLISHFQKTLISRTQKHLICGQIYDSRGSGYRCFELEDIGVKVVVCLRITTLQRQPATGEGRRGGGGGGKGELL